VCGDQVYIEAIAGVAAFIVALAGYRIYKTSLGLCGALTACSFMATAGLIWYGGGGNGSELLSNDIASMSSNITSTPDMADMSESDWQPVKLGVIAFFCCVWSVMGALICLRVYEKVQKFIGFICGAVLGMALMGFLIDLVSSELHNLGTDIDDEYAGWQAYIEIAAGVPFSLIVGYVLRNIVAYVIMAITSLLGSFVGVCLSVHTLQCLAEIDVHHRVTLGGALLFGVGTFLVQFLDFTLTRKSSDTPEEGLSVV